MDNEKAVFMKILVYLSSSSREPCLFSIRIIFMPTNH